MNIHITVCSYNALVRNAPYELPNASGARLLGTFTVDTCIVGTCIIQSTVIQTNHTVQYKTMIISTPAFVFL